MDNKDIEKIDKVEGVSADSGSNCNGLCDGAVNCRMIRLWRLLLSPRLWVCLLPLLLLVSNVVLSFTEHNSVLAKVTDVVLPLGVYLLVCGMWRKLGRTMLWLTILMVFCAFQIVLFFLYGESIIAIDMFMNVMTTSVGEATELLGNLSVAILTVCAIYLPPIAVGVYYVVKKVRLDSVTRSLVLRIGGVFTAVGVVLLLLSVLCVDNYNARRELFPYNVMENLVTAVNRHIESLHYHETSAGFKYNVKCERADSLRQVYIMVIGETSRAHNWQLLGYDRPTNPFLMKRHGVVCYGKALSEINTTHKSVPMLMSSLTAESFGEGINVTRSIFEAFDEAGYATAFISNQRRNHSYIDFFGEQARYVRFLTDNGGPCEDMALINALDRYLASTDARRVFVVLHCYGSHFKYNRRYGRGESFFKPDGNAEADVANRGQLINAYDNTIRVTDRLLSEIIGRLTSLKCVGAMIYTSDHGEDIYDDSRKRFLHASPVPTYWQLHVPMLVWTSDEYERLYPEKVAAMRDNSNKEVSTTRSMFVTMVDLAGMTSPCIDMSMSLASDDYRQPVRLYLNDYNEAVPLNTSGLREEDFEMFAKKDISVK